MKKNNASGAASELAQVKAGVVNRIRLVTDEYSQDSIEQVFNRIVNTEEGRGALDDPQEITRLVFARLSHKGRGQSRKLSEAACAARSQVLRDYISDDAKDEFVDG